MKRKGKIWFFVLAIFLVVLAVLPITGLTSRYGDAITTIARGAEDVEFGSDITGIVTARYSPLDKASIIKREEVPASSASGSSSASEETAATTVQETNLVSIQKNLLITRLTQESITGYTIDANEKNGQITVSFPHPASLNADADVARMVNKLVTFGSFILRDGEGIDSDDNVLLKNGQLASAAMKTLDPANEGDASQYYIEATLSATYAEEVFAHLADASQNEITFWMDGKQIDITSVSPGTNENTLDIHGNFSQQEAQNIADVMNGGALSYAMRLDGFSSVSPLPSDNFLRNLGIAVVIGLGLIVVFMLVTHNLTGILSLLCIAGYAGMMLVMLTGFFTVYPAFPVTLPAILSVFLCVGMSAWGNIIISSHLRAELNTGKKIDAAIKDGYRKSLTPFYDINFVLAIVAIVLMGAFGSPTGTFGKILSPLFFALGQLNGTALHGMGYILMIGVFLNLIFGYCCHYGLVYTITRFEAFRKPALFGANPAASAEEKDKKQNTPVAVAFKGGKQIALLSIAVMVLALVISFIPGVKLDSAQTAGSMLQYSFEQDLDISSVQQLANTVLGDNASVKQSGKSVRIFVPYSASLDASLLSSFHAQLIESNPDAGLVQQFANGNTAAYSFNHLLRILIAIAFAVVLAMLFMAYRFRRTGKWKLTFAALLSMAVPTVASYIAFVIIGAPIGLSFVGVAFIVFGFTFANIALLYYKQRENRASLGKKTSLTKLLGTSLAQTKGISVMMLLSLLMPVVSLCIVSIGFNMQSLFHISLPAIVGILFGYFTSRLLSSYLWALWDGKPLQANASKVQ